MPTPKTGPTKRNVDIITGSSGAVKAYLDKILKFRPTVQATFRFYLALIAAFDFPLSSRANSLHGPVALCGLLAAMSYTKSCGNRAAKLFALQVADVCMFGDLGSVHLPTSQWALKMMAALDHEAMERACRAGFRACIAAARARGMVPDRPVGMMDGHGAAYYGKKGDESFSVKSKGKDGTSTFDMFLASAIRAGPYALHTAMCRMRRGIKLEVYVRSILEQNREAGIKCSHWLVDRLFFSVATMCEFGRADEYFLMYARATPGIKKALEEYKAGVRAAVSEYVVRSGRAKFVGVLSFVKKTKTKKDGTKEDVIIPIFSNLPPDLLEEAIRNLPAALKRRWMHETALRVAKMSKPMTTSNSPTLRTFLFWASLANANMWAMSDHDYDIKRRAEEGLPPIQMPPPDGGIGKARRRAPRREYHVTSKEHLRMTVSEAARLITMTKREQDAYTEKAVVENAHLVPPPASQRITIMTGARASGIPHWG